jgi:ribosomal protein S12 methylthiotransferase accessory factor
MTTAGLRAATDAYVRVLGSGLRAEFSLTGFDHVGVPVRAAWWHQGDVATGGVGYGATDDQARVGALGEAAENVLSALAVPLLRPVDGSFAELRQARGDGVLDPGLLGLPAGAPWNEDRPLRWLPMRRVERGGGLGEPVLVPAEFVASAPGELPAAWPGGWLTTPVTNGLGAGGSLAHALAHGVGEVLQRDGNGLEFRALDAGRVLDLAAATDPVTLDVLARLRAAGVEPLAKLAATDFGLPNVYVVGRAPGDDLVTATACGEAVHPDRDVALRKAVLEFASARARKRFMHGPLRTVAELAPEGYLDDALSVLDPAAEEPRVLAATLDWLAGPADRWEPMLTRTVFSRRTSVPFPALPTTPAPPDAAGLLADLQGRLAAEGFEVLAADLSPASGDGAPPGAVHAVKVVVPGLEVETVAYGRIGERNARRLLEAGRDDLLRGGRHPHGWQRVHLTPEATERLGGPAWVDREALDAVAAGLLPLYREPSRHTAQLALGAGSR